MTGTVAGLDVSADGSRVLVGKAVSTDTKGNTYYDLYMHVGSNPNSVQVVDTASGVIFNGMTDDGSKVFFTTPDAVPGTGDTDTSADLFRADVGTTSASIVRVSTGTGGAGNIDACNPVPGKEGPDWNVLSAGRPIAASSPCRRSRGRLAATAPSSSSRPRNSTDPGR